MSSPTTPSGAETPAQQPKRFSPLSLVLYGVFAVALLALGFDLLARRSASSAYSRIDSLLYADEEGTSKNQARPTPQTPAGIQTLVGRKPNETASADNEFREVYRWRGVFNTYMVDVVYGGSMVSLDGTKTEPMLSKVHFRSSGLLGEGSEPEMPELKPRYAVVEDEGPASETGESDDDEAEEEEDEEEDRPRRGGDSDAGDSSPTGANSDASGEEIPDLDVLKKAPDAGTPAPADPESGQNEEQSPPGDGT